MAPTKTSEHAHIVVFDTLKMWLLTGTLIM